jgi:ubiquinone biosynthesis protein
VKAVAHAGGAIASIARAVVISCVALLCVIAYSVGSLHRLAMRDRRARDEHRSRQRGRLLRWSFARLGPTFVKIGQIASSRPDLFSAGVIAELRTLQDRVPPFSYRRVRATLERELGGPIETQFRELDRTPVAAGGIAQVHRGVLVDGDEVAVKVLRPGVRARVRRDARLVLWLAHVAHALSPRARAADVIGHARSLVGGIVAQTELRFEARNYKRFRREFAGWSTVAFPRVYRRYSTNDVLVMEFVHGVTIDRVRPEHEEQVARALRDAFFAMCFDHGLVHADLHPGNILVRDDGGIVLVDVGLVKHLAPSVIDKIIDFTRCIVFGDAGDLVVHLQRYHHHLPSTDWNAVAADAVAFIADLRRLSIAELEIGAIVARLFALARKHGIRPMPELSLVLLGIVTVEGIAKRLTPDANTMTEIAQFLGPRLATGRRLARGSREWLKSPAGPRPEPSALASKVVPQLVRQDDALAVARTRSLRR